MAKLYYDYEKNCPIFCKGFCLDLDSHLKLFFIMDEYGLSFKISGKDPDRKIRQCAHLWCMAVSAHTQGCHVKKTNPNLRMYVKDSWIKQVEMEQFWNLAHKINEISISIFEELYVTFLDYMLWKKARHDQIYWVCTAHLALLKYTPMVRSCDVLNHCMSHRLSGQKITCVWTNDSYFQRLVFICAFQVTKTYDVSYVYFNWENAYWAIEPTGRITILPFRGFHGIEKSHCILSCFSSMVIVFALFSIFDTPEHIETNEQGNLYMQSCTIFCT